MVYSLCMKHQKKALVLAGMSGALGFAPIYALPVFILTLVFALLICDGLKTYFKAGLTGYLYGLGFFCAGFYWISNALLVDAKTFGWLYGVALLAPGVFLGLFFVPPFVFWHYLKNRSVFEKIFGFASICVLMEYIRSFLLTGFPWNMFGSMFAFSDVLLQTASVIGTYGLSFLLLIITGACYAFVKKEYKLAGLTLFLILVPMFIFGIWRLRLQEDGVSNLKVRLVQPSIPQNLKWDENTIENNLKTYIDMSRQKGLEDVSMVVWGETAVAFDLQNSIYYQRLITQAVPQNGYLMTGVLRVDRANRALYNSLTVIDNNGIEQAFYDKNHLVPFGEYIPFRKYLPKQFRPIANQIADFSTGEKYKILKVKGLPDFGALICYEIIFPDQVVNRKKKPNFLVLVSNDGWYGQSFGPYQHLVAARLRAIEEGITIIRSANNGISAVIGPKGQILGQIGLNEIGIKDIYLPKNLTKQTIYALFGGLNFQILMILIIAGLLFNKKRSKK